MRTDAAGATRAFAAHLAQLGVEFSLGANLGHFDIHPRCACCPRPSGDARLPGHQAACWAVGPADPALCGGEDRIRAHTPAPTTKDLEALATIAEPDVTPAHHITTPQATSTTQPSGHKTTMMNTELALPAC